MFVKITQECILKRTPQRRVSGSRAFLNAALGVHHVIESPSTKAITEQSFLHHARRCFNILRLRFCKWWLEVGLGTKMEIEEI